MPKYILALDQGTTPSRAILFDAEQNILSMTRRELTQIYPREGWVEHDPMEIWSSQHGMSGKSGAPIHEIAAIGITNQRKTAVLWEQNTGRPI